MATDDQAIADNPELQANLRESGVVPIKPKNTKVTPTYRVNKDSKIPVSSANGPLWKTRRDQALYIRRQRDDVRSWDEAIKYYNNDQMGHRSEEGDPDVAANQVNARGMSRRASETENIVFANTSALVPQLYAKNPTVETTAIDPADEALADVVQDVTNVLLSKRAAPGVGLRGKVRRSVVMTTLTNVSYLQVGWTFKMFSQEQALVDLQTLSEQYTKETDMTKLRAIEGKLQALEMSTDLLKPEGPWVKFHRPHDVLIDPEALDEDYSDARWLMICEFLPTAFIKAKFADDKDRSVYAPKRVISLQRATESGRNEAQVEIDNYTLIDDIDSSQAWDRHGYPDSASYDRALRNKVWYVWDKITKRVYLYDDDHWDWPLWVWDDPLRLDGFFPLFKLCFYTDPEYGDGKGEVTYYLDQQDSLNEINSELNKARKWARRNIFYDVNKVKPEEVEAMLRGDEDVAIGVDVPEGMAMNDFIQPVLPPSMHVKELFDKTPILDAVSRITSVSEAGRGGEYKTNTTNDAVQQYAATNASRTDEKIDSVENLVGQVSWALMQMCLQFMDKEAVARLIGEQKAAIWEQIPAAEISKRLQMTVVGGSTVKPTSMAKQQQAMELGQVLGQFAGAAPQAVTSVMLRVFERAFDEVLITEEDWAMMQAEVGGTPTGSEGEQQETDPAAQIDELLARLPPQAIEAVGLAISKGVPVTEALQQVMQTLESTPQ